MKQTPCPCKCIVIVVLLAITAVAVVSSGYVICNGLGCTACEGFIAIAALSLLLLIGVLCCTSGNCTEEATQKSITEEKIELWVRNAVNHNMPLRVDEYVTTCVSTRLEQSISQIQSKVVKKIDNVHLVQTSYLSFLETLAKEIGKPGTAWTADDIKRFMECFESVTESLKRITAED